LGGHYLSIALLFNNVCFFVALVYVYRYARLVGADRAAALLAVTLLCVLPQSIAFSAALTESLFLLLLAMAMYHLRREQFLIAGIAAALLSATRANGILFVFFALVWIVRNGGLRAFIAPWRHPELFVPVVLAPLGVFAFWAYCLVATGDAFAHPSTELYGWGWRFAAPWENLPAMMQTKGRIGEAAILSIGVFCCSFVLLRQRLYEEFAVCAALILLMWSSEGNVSVFRYMLVLFPIWIGVARVLAPRPLVCAAALAAIGMINGLMMCAWTLGNDLAL
ncbi:MAG TPA: mannosyltransferase family protein, partial [Rudaea sp.]